jgi:bifunctional non-homologous end joining protein LigD
LQLWKGRTIPAYSVRATPHATISTPIEWSEVEHGFDPTDFTIRTIPQRLKQKGDLFSPITTQKSKYEQEIDTVLSFLKNN